jgi:hypothetical protein
VSLEKIIAEAEKLVIPIALAIAGGAASYTLRKEDRRRKRKIVGFISDLIVWIYVGMASYYVLDNFPDLSASWKSVIISFSGFCAHEILGLAKEKFMFLARQKINSDTEKKG